MERNQTIVFRVSIEEKMFLQNLAGKEQSNLSDFIRKKLFSALLDIEHGTIEDSKETLKLQKRTLFSLKKIVEKLYTPEEQQQITDYLKKIE